MAPFFYKIFKMTENNKEEQRPSKMIGVVFPKAKYGVIVAIIIIAIMTPYLALGKTTPIILLGP